MHRMLIGQEVETGEGGVDLETERELEDTVEVGQGTGGHEQGQGQGLQTEGQRTKETPDIAETPKIVENQEIGDLRVHPNLQKRNRMFLSSLTENICAIKFVEIRLNNMQ